MLSYDGLTGDDRLGKLSAAKALLADRDESAIELLERLAADDPDEVTGASFRAVAARLRGIAEVERLFLDPETDPRLARLLLSNYNSDLVPDAGDVRFLVLALRTYVDRSLPWLDTLRQDLWDNGAYLILVGLTHASAMDQLCSEPLAAERAALLPLLERVVQEDGDDDLVAEAHGLRDALAG